MRTYHIIILGITVATLLTLAGCRSHKETPQKETKPARVCRCGYQSMEASFTSEVQGVSVNGAVRTRCDSIVWVSVSKVVELGRLRLTPDSVHIYLKILNQAYRGTYDDVYSKTGYRISYDEIQRKLDDCYRNNGKTVVFDVNARQIKQRLVMNIRRMEASEKGLTYPFSIPPTAKPVTL